MTTTPAAAPSTATRIRARCGRSEAGRGGAREAGRVDACVDGIGGASDQDATLPDPTDDALADALGRLDRQLEARATVRAAAVTSDLASVWAESWSTRGGQAQDLVGRDPVHRDDQLDLLRHQSGPHARR